MTAYNSGAFNFPSRIATQQSPYHLLNNPTVPLSFIASLGQGIRSTFTTVLPRTGTSINSYYRPPLAALPEVAGSRKQSWGTFG
ncbi:MAG: hypothetical protein CMB76_02610 [Euryarchaeota archaeon]|nr:hypothetical protein [Euryarchaeota archaeon]|tara:strand:+ start:2696 stop:2947 length:252 start_codon:yes stop_codon:yes gene_type:complete